MEVRSPCVLRCLYDLEMKQCTGCLRTIPEIEGWWKMSDGERKLTLQRIAERRRENKSKDPHHVGKTKAP